MTSGSIVLSVFPQAFGKEFLVGGCEIYLHKDIDAPDCYLLGSGFSLNPTPEQEEADYKATMDAAWDHAAYYVAWAKEWLSDAKPGGDYHYFVVANQRFETFRQWFRRYHKVNHNRVSKKEFLQKLALALKRQDELAEE